MKQETLYDENLRNKIFFIGKNSLNEKTLDQCVGQNDEQNTGLKNATVNNKKSEYKGKVKPLSKETFKQLSKLYEKQLEIGITYS